MYKKEKIYIYIYIYTYMCTDDRASQTTVLKDSSEARTNEILRKAVESKTRTMITTGMQG